MESILNVEVSCFANYNTPANPAPVNLLQWLTSDKYKAQVEQIRSLETKADPDRIKATLPAITPSGTFTYRDQKDLIQHSGFLQFDIDLKENKHITNYPDLKRQLCNIPNVAYCALSVSGTGFWGLIPIAYPEKHRQHFEALEQAFGGFGINIDTAPKNVASLRGYSYDPAPYFNHQATVFQVYSQPPVRKPTASISNATSESAKVETCLAEIERHQADLTGSYTAWFEVGCSLAGSFGEEGREYYHRVSQFHPHYSPSKTDRQYSACLKGTNRFTLATFFEYCAQAQIRYKNLTDSPKPEPTETPASASAELMHQYRAREEEPIQRPGIYAIKEKDQWNLEELEAFFAGAAIPMQPVQLYPWAKITDPGTFIQSHLAYLRANNGKRNALPHLERLERLRSILEGIAIQVPFTPLLHSAA